MTASNMKVKIFRGDNISVVENVVNNFCNRKEIMVHSITNQVTIVGNELNEIGVPTNQTFFDTVTIVYQEVEL